MSFRFQQLEIPDVVMIEPVRLIDRRGLFMETYKRSQFAEHGIPEFVQDNFSSSTRGVLRGLHYQKPPKAQSKLVLVLSGEIFDVAVDIREGAPTYGHWLGVTISGKDPRMLYIPDGFAHGFCVLSEKASVLYKTTAEYDPDMDRGIIWSDPQVGVRWPVDQPILSERDAKLPTLAMASKDFTYVGRR